MNIKLIKIICYQNSEKRYAVCVINDSDKDIYKKFDISNFSLSISPIMASCFSINTADSIINVYFNSVNFDNFANYDTYSVYTLSGKDIDKVFMIDTDNNDEKFVDISYLEDYINNNSITIDTEEYINL